MKNLLIWALGCLLLGVSAAGAADSQRLNWNVDWKQGVKLAMAVREPEDADKKIIVAGWGWFPTRFSWTWPGWEGKTMEVEVYSRHEKTRLYLNGAQVGEEPTKSKGGSSIYKVPYQPGVLKAVGLENGKQVEEVTLTTTGDPAALRLKPDRTVIKADGQDLSFVQVEVVDHGKALIVLRGTRTAGNLQLQAAADNLSPATASVNTE